MAWMGRLPMLFHPSPRRALVICFGTGQTANAVRREGPVSLDIIELSPAVIRAAPLFRSNEAVLDDPRTHLHLMDGRAWLRRTSARYDVVTLEPMAPYFAGTNALYSLEFYQLVARRLEPGGVVAQWLPVHIVTPDDAAAITRTFQEVFPQTWLWIDPVDRTGILLGRREGQAGADPIPGVARPAPGRDLEPQAIRRGLLFGPEGARRLAAYGRLITDDNQLLAYGEGRRDMQALGYRQAAHAASLAILRDIAAGAPLGARPSK
jgi:hypothetical protein